MWSVENDADLNLSSVVPDDPGDDPGVGLLNTSRKVSYSFTTLSVQF